jgi:hypothetical protein
LHRYVTPFKLFRKAVEDNLQFQSLTITVSICFGDSH